jgi:two-component system, cell cycle sensor histidine kinase and response regulator CckA
MSIHGYVSLMLFDLDSAHPHYENLKKIETQVKKAVHLTNTVQAFAHKEKPAVQPVNVGTLAETILKKFGEGKKDLQIEFRNPEDLWLAAAEGSKIEQVLLSLLINAWEAMSGKGLLSLEAANIKIGQEEGRSLLLPAGEYVKISVTDHGAGIEKGLQQRIFEPFFTTKEKGKGTGLSLATAYSIIRNQEGNIQFRSVRGEGTTFDLYLPVWAGDHASPPEIVLGNKSFSQTSSGKETVLLVDDEDTIIDVIGMALKMIGYQVLIAKKGEEAIEIYRQHKEDIALVILDMLLPGMDGGKAFDLLKVINPQIKVLLSSGFSYNEEAAQIIARGCSGFIQKPFGIKELSQKIRELLDAPAR